MEERIMEGEEIAEEKSLAYFEKGVLRKSSMAASILNTLREDYDPVIKYIQPVQPAYATNNPNQTSFMSFPKYLSDSSKQPPNSVSNFTNSQYKENVASNYSHPTTPVDLFSHNHI